METAIAAATATSTAIEEAKKKKTGRSEEEARKKTGKFYRPFTMIKPEFDPVKGPASFSVFTVINL